MINYGKLTMVRGYTDPTGEYHDYVASFNNTDGVEWHDLHRNNPELASAFYIAIDDMNRVVTTHADFEQIQIANLTILGFPAEKNMQEYFVDNPAGTGMQFDLETETVIPKVLLQEEFKKADKGKLLLALYRQPEKYKSADVLAGLNALPDDDEKEEALIEWENYSQFERNDSSTILFFTVLGITDEARINEIWLQALS